MRKKSSGGRVKRQRTQVNKIINSRIDRTMIRTSTNQLEGEPVGRILESEIGESIQEREGALTRVVSHEFVHLSLSLR
jgi:hypothetical protein